MISFHIEHVAIAKRHCRDDLANVGDEVFNSTVLWVAKALKH